MTTTNYTTNAVDASMMAQYTEVPVAVKTGSVENLSVVKSPVQTTIFLQPIAHPSVLGLTGFFASTWIVSTFLCGWYGSIEDTPSGYLFFVMLMGGVGQAIAGLFAFRARDDFAVVIHWTWGSFFIYTTLEDLLRVMKYLPALESRYYSNPGVTMVFATLMAITWVCAVAMLAREAILFAMTVLLATGATIAVPGFHYGHEGTIKAAGYFFMLSAICALYRVLVFLVKENFGTMPNWLVFKLPWESVRGHVTIPINEPGVKKGQ